MSKASATRCGITVSRTFIYVKIEVILVLVFLGFLARLRF